MGRLICKKCGGYYELQDEESPDDFDKCSCGGDLEFVDFSEDNEINVKMSLLNHIYKKILLIMGIFIILGLFFYVMDPFTPTVEKMDKIMPNKVGAYYVPDKSDNMILSDESTKPVSYHDNYSKSVSKYYFKPGSQVKMHVIMYDTGGGINVIGNKFAENRMINGKEVRFLQFDLYSYMALFHGSDYSITITAEPAFKNSHIYVNDLQNELFSFTENFISELNK